MAAVTESGTFTDPTDLLSLMRPFLISAGWTENLYAAEGSAGGYRLHVQKVVSGTTHYLNFRSAYNEKIIKSTYPSIFGIALNMSKGFDAGDIALEQPGYLSEYGSHTEPTAGGVYLNSVAGAYSYLFISDSDHVSFLVEDIYGDMRPIILSIGTGGFAYYSSYSFGLWYDNRYSDYTSPNNFMRNWSTSQYVVNYACCLLSPDGDYYAVTSGASSTDGNICLHFTNNASYGYVYNLWANSPNPNSGLPVLVPFVCTRPSSKAYSVGMSGDPVQVIDDLKNIKVVNTKYLDSNTDIAVGGETYRVIKTGTSISEGIAIKIS